MLRSLWIAASGSLLLTGTAYPEEDSAAVGKYDYAYSELTPWTATKVGPMRDEEENDAYKSPTELIHLLCDVVSKNGNLLLNIGPRGDGTIPEGMRKRLLAIGRWQETNGEAIYGRRRTRVGLRHPPWDREVK